MSGHLDFLSPDRAVATAGHRPLLRSCMERRQRDAGATFEERDGWLLPVSFPGEAERSASAAVADLSHLGKIEVRGATPEERNGTVVYPVKPGRSLVLCPYGECGWHRDRLAPAADGLLDVTAAFGVLAVAGPEAPRVMRRITDITRFPGSGTVAHVPAHVLLQEDAYWIVFPQEYGHSLWEAVVDAAEPLGGGPVGVDAVLREGARA